MTSIWKQSEAEIIRHFEGCYTLIYRGKPVMPETSFEVLTRYVWAEFISE